MKILKSILFTSFIALLCACSGSRSTEYSVTGMVNDSSANGKKIYIMRYDDRQNIDSTVIENNRFTFTGNVDTASYCRINVDRKLFANFILENGDIVVDLQKHNSPSGSLLNDKLSQLSQETDAFFEMIAQQRKETMEQCKGDKEAFNQRMKEFMGEQYKSIAQRCADLYEGHWDDAFGYALLYSDFFNFIPMEQQKALIAKYGNWLKSTKAVQKISTTIEARLKSAEGMPYIDITGVDAEGKATALSNFIGKGNYILVDMWASWCGPCKGEIPNLAKLHKKYNGKGLTVVGVFVWDKAENLKPAMSSEGVTWSQIIDTQENATKLYGVEGIPHILLISPDGTILKRGLRGENMIRTVEEILSSK